MASGKSKKSKAALDKLKESAQQAIYERVEGGTLATAKAYIEAEFGIVLSETSIGEWAGKRRFDKNFREALEQRLAKIIRARDNADLFVAELDKSPANISKANVALLGQAFMDAQLSGDPKEIAQLAVLYSALLDSVAKDKRADASVQDSNTARRKFEFDAADAVLKNLDALNVIRQSNASQPEKQRAVVLRMFGPRPEEPKS